MAPPKKPRSPDGTYWLVGSGRRTKLVCVHDPIDGCDQCRKERRRITNDGWRGRNPEKVKEKNAKIREKFGDVYSKRYMPDVAAWQAVNRDKVTSYKFKHKDEKAGFIYAPGQTRDVLMECATVCEGCGSSFAQLPKNSKHLDHDHSITDRPNIRGVLCRKCNWSLGACADSVEILQGLIRYLEKWRAQND